MCVLCVGTPSDTASAAGDGDSVTVGAEEGPHGEGKTSDQGGEDHESPQGD